MKEKYQNLPEEIFKNCNFLKWCDLNNQNDRSDIIIYNDHLDSTLKIKQKIAKIERCRAENI